MGIIARETFTGHSSEGEAFEVCVEIGVPYPWQGSDDEWACPVKINPLYPSLRDVHGGSSLQALCLALRLTKSLLDDFVEKGGKLIYGSVADGGVSEPSSNVDLNATFGTTKQ
jgi:hypothetical protein